MFAKKFDLTDIATVKKFDLVTAFEVFEHFVNPIEEIQKILDLGDDILFSTELQPSLGINNWEYLSLNTGQHVSLWSLKSLNKVADKFHLKLYSDGKSLHYLTRNKKINEFAFRISINSKVANIVDLLINRRNTLQKSDHEFLIKNSFEI